MKEIFEMNRLLMNDMPYSFLLEILFRCVVMYLVALIVLKLAGRRGIKQLSVFELVIILTLGSAAGDSLFYEDVGLIIATAVFVFIILLYRLTTFIISNSKKAEIWLEGEPIYLIENGEFSFENFKKESLAVDEFFSELREKNVSHIGQVDLAILETSGEISIFYFEDESVKYGLPILPHKFNNKEKTFEANSKYACRECTNIQSVDLNTTQLTCNRCGKKSWTKAVNNKRIT